MGRRVTRVPAYFLVLVAAVLIVPAVKSNLSHINATARPQGLVQAGNSKTTCIDVPLANHDPRSLVPLERSLGIDFTCLETFSDADITWGAWIDPWITRKGYGYAKWLAANPKGRTIIVTQNLVPDNVAKLPNWRTLCARGEYRSYAKALGRRLVATGFGYSVIRLGHEMNGSWYVDNIGSNVGQWEAWAGCFRQIVTAMRSVKGEHFLFDWNVNAGYENIPLHYYYPGDRYVDIVGIDDYDRSQAVTLPPVGSPQRFDVLSSEPLGLYALERFATTHGKPLSIPEWGTYASVGDDPAYVHALAAFIASHDIAYQSWFDTGGQDTVTLEPSQAPNMYAAYVASFGKGSALANYQQRFTSGG